MHTPIQIDQRKNQTIATAFGFIVSGISWLSFNIPAIKYLTLPIGLSFLAFSLCLVILSLHARLLPTAETTTRAASYYLMPILLASVSAALYNATGQIAGDWRFLFTLLIVVIFLAVVIVSWIIITIARCKRKEYRKHQILAFIVTLILITLACLFLPSPG